MLNMCVLGTGYVGLVTGTCLAEIGHSVMCVDTDRRKIDKLLDGEIPIYEPGLEALVRENAAAGRLGFTGNLGEGMNAETLVVFVAVGTPTADDGTADLRALFAAVEQVARIRHAAPRDGFMALVIKSTVPVGTCRKVQALVEEYLPAESFGIVSNPEFLREGCAIEDFMSPDRIVVGTGSAAAMSLMRRTYAPLTRRGHLLLEVSSIETSEMIKYASNVFLATKIGLINEFSRLCEKVGADVEELALGIGQDRRIGPASLKAGPGFGGSCFPKDLRALVELAGHSRSPMPIAEAVIASNEEQKHAMAHKIAQALGGDVAGRRIAVLGLSFKAGTDDIRESPPLTIIEDLTRAGALITAFDPAAMSNSARVLADVEFVESAAESIAGAEAVVIATEWPEFMELDWSDMLPRMAQPNVVDLRNILDAAYLERIGYRYIGLGRSGASLAGEPRMPVLAPLAPTLSDDGPALPMDVEAPLGTQQTYALSEGLR